ncbi:transposase [Escherichia coli]|nr:transposase [Escherichia coli]
MKKRNFSAEFKRESAQLVVDQNYTVADPHRQCAVRGVD